MNYSFYTTGLFCGLFMLLMHLAAHAQVIPLPDDAAVSVHVAVGRGQAAATIRNGELELKVQPDTLGDYVDNTSHTCAVFDAMLNQPVDLPADARAVALEYANPRDLNLGVQGELRAILRDSRGLLWAVATKMGIRNGRLNYTHGFATIETYPFATQELGRVDRWVMTRLDPADTDEYVKIQPPLQLAGFRLITDGSGKTLTIKARKFTALAAQQMPDPYWLLVPQRLWLVQNGMDSADWGRYGWGPSDPRPYLKPSDLGLPNAPYELAWEITASDQWRTIASDRSQYSPSEPDAPMVQLPMLPAGTYTLHLIVRQHQESSPREFYMTYVAVRNSHSASQTLPQNKLISLSSKAGATFQTAQDAAVHIDLHPSVSGSHEIIWTVASQDKRILSQGRASTNTPVIIPLAEALEKERVCWVTAQLMDGKRTLDVVRRIVGLAGAPTASAPSPSADKRQSIAGKFLRTKGDWFEGATPVVSQSPKMLELFGPWMDEAQQTGYNVVELSAPWFDVNPLPDVYQFSYLNRLVDLARQRGLSVVLRVHATSDLVPAWVPREFQEDQNHRVHGLWSGGNTLVYSPCSQSLQQALNTYLQALAAHFQHDSNVIGYTLSSLHYDHDLLDQPWLGQYVDYSQIARRAFIAYLQSSFHGDLAEFNRQLGMQISDWNQIVPPTPEPRLDAAGRLMPRNDPFWRQWITFKIQSIRNWRLSGAEALLKGDPTCWVGLYASDTSPIYLDDIARHGLAMTYGSMELQFPERNEKIPGRYEPHAKIARTSTLVDVGLSNILLAADPGYHGFFNYWKPEWRRTGLTEPEQQAERRLKQWFAILDQVAGAKSINPETTTAKRGLYLTSFDSLLFTKQHTFSGRQEDDLKPFVFALGRDQVQAEPLSTTDLPQADLAGIPYIYVPYCTDVLDHATIARLSDYVRQGGRLILESTSGYWQLEPLRSQALTDALGLPAINPVNIASSDMNPSRAAQGCTESPFSGDVAVRVRPYSPPIQTQPTPWIHVIPGAYFRPYTLGSIPDSEVLARFADHTPALADFPVGQGHVLVFAGVADWLGCPGLARSIDTWGRTATKTVAITSASDVIVNTYSKQNRVYRVGRRFIDQPAIADLKVGNADPRLADKRATVIRFTDGISAENRYRVTELLSHKSFGLADATQLTRDGLELLLAPGEAFVLEAIPENGSHGP